MFRWALVALVMAGLLGSSTRVEAQIMGFGWQADRKSMLETDVETILNKITHLRQYIVFIKTQKVLTERQLDLCGCTSEKETRLAEELEIITFELKKSAKAIDELEVAYVSLDHEIRQLDPPSL